MKSSGDPGARRLKSWGIHGEPECHQCAPRDEPNETKLSGRFTAVRSAAVPVRWSAWLGDAPNCI